MATLGSLADFQARLKKLMPRSWFPNPAPVLMGALAGAANVFSDAYAQLKYAKLQTRIGTTTDANLEIAAVDFVALRIQRRPGESDAGFRVRIIQEALRLRNTRAAMIAALTQLTGRAPTIYAPWSTNDCGAMDAGGLACDVAGCTATGIDAASTIRNAVFINAFRPLGGSGLAVSDAEIYAMAYNVAAAGVTAWVNIQN